MSELFKDLKQCLYCWLLSQQGKQLSKKLPFRNMEEPIDFVVTWVDGDDPIWRAQKEQYEREIGIVREHKDNGEARYRDWDLFVYWFRAVEKYAPWVRHVYLVTCGQIPEWLNLKAPKLKLVDHRDFIPQSYLPTFNCNVIELNLHRIEGLSEHFVYFNDDVFLMRPCQPEDFFQAGQPNHCAVAYPLRNEDNCAFYHGQFTVLGAINNVFGGRFGEIAAEHPEKWFSYEYGENVFYNKHAVHMESLPGMFAPHLAVPTRRSTFKEVWDTYPALLHETSAHRFRRPEDAILQLLPIWDMMKADFNPVSMEHAGKLFSNPVRDIDDLMNTIGSEKCLSICINDSEYVSHEEYLSIKMQLSEKMEAVFHKKSSFEK